MCCLNVVVRDIWFYYRKGVYIFKGANAEFKCGRINVLVGPVGGGKTTLLLLISGLIIPQKGEILIGNSKAHQIDRKIFGVAFQNPDDQLFNPTVYDELAYSVRKLKSNFKEDVLKIANKFGIEKLLNKRVLELSFGEKKLVSIASVLVHDPTIILLDEPTANLSPKNKRMLKNTLIDLKIKKKNIIIATHDVNFAKEIADNLFLVRDGKVFQMDKNVDLEDLLD